MSYMVCVMRNVKYFKPSFHDFLIVRYKCSKPVQGPPWNILFFGTDAFALRSLRSLWAKYNTGTTISKLGVVTNPGTLVEKFALSEKLDILKWPPDLSKNDPNYHIGMIVSFGKMIPKDLIDAFPLGCINVHASLLPKWRGAAPIIHSIINGDNETGVTIMRIHPHKFDVGEIVRQYRISIEKDERTPQLETRLSECGANLLMECIRDMPRCVQAAVKQPSDGVSYAPKVTPAIARVEWNKMTCDDVYNLFRGISHLYPLTTSWQGQIVKFHDVTLSNRLNPLSRMVKTAKGDTSSALSFLGVKPKAATLKSSTPSIPPGSINYSKATNTILVSCADGKTISFGRITFKGKTMSAKDFYNGFMTKVDRSLWKFVT